MTEQISWFPIANRDTLSPETQALFGQLEQKPGFVPNVFVAFAWREERFKRWFAHYEHLMEPSEGLSKAEREMVAVAVSSENDCLYCMTAHGFALRALMRDPVTAERITLDYRRAGLSERHRAMLDYAVKVTREPVECSEADIEGLRGLGFCDEDIWDIAEIACMFNYTNRLMSATGTMPNAEYHGMAR
jgi:uncharacterized peroxidase-related enzyme